MSDLALGWCLPRCGQRLQDEHGVGLKVGAGAGQVGEGRVRTEAVVVVVVAGLEGTGGDDEPLADEPRPEGCLPLGCPGRRRSLGG